MKLILSIFFSILLIASNPKDDYIAFMDTFMKNTELSFDFIVVQNAQNASQLIRGSYKRSNNQYILKNENFTVIAAKELTITIYENDKWIFLDEPKPANNFILVDTKSMNDALTKVTEISNQDASIKQWQITAKDWDGIGVIKADIKKNIPIQISMYHKGDVTLKNKPMMKINFSNVSTDPQNSEIFKISTYIQKKGSNWVLSPKYSKYELINNLD